MEHLPAALTTRAARTGGLITHRDLVRLGFDRSEIQRIKRQLITIRRGAYCLELPDKPEAAHQLTSRATLMANSESQYLSHASAAVVWELPLFAVSLDKVHLSRDRGQRAHSTRNVVYHRNPIPMSDRALRDGLRVTTVARVITDCAMTLPTACAVVMADAALHRGLTSADELAERLSIMTRRKGIFAARRVLALVDAKSESPGESRLRLVLGDLGIPVDSQAVITDGGQVIARADFRVRSARVLIEFDGRAKYRDDPERHHWDEKQRHDRLVATGFEIVRIVWRQLDQPELVGRAIEKALARSCRRGVDR